VSNKGEKGVSKILSAGHWAVGEDHTVVTDVQTRRMDLEQAKGYKDQYGGFIVARVENERDEAAIAQVPNLVRCCYLAGKALAEMKDGKAVPPEILKMLLPLIVTTLRACGGIATVEALFDQDLQDAAREEAE